MLIKEIPWQKPTTAFERLYKNNGFSVLLDSSLNNALGRYSIIAANPSCILKSKNNTTQLIRNGKVKSLNENPFDVLKGLLNQYKLQITDYRLPFCGGALGYFGYDLLHHLERIKHNRIDDLNIPDAIFGIFDSCIVFDHLQNKAFIASVGLADKDREKAKKRLEILEKQLDRERKDDSYLLNKNNNLNLKLKSTLSKKQYIQRVQRAKRHIKEGDIYQVNLSQRFEAEFKGNPWDLYLRLREISPNPFGGFLNFGSFQLLCSSPERFLKVQNNIVQTRPMKGTRPRGETRHQDNLLRNDLLGSEKDSAELLMITDLLRNDLGKVCEYSSVKVKKIKNLEKYSNVFQTTALVEGRLHKSKDRIDLIKACFPGGSITGAPKVRAMQIISELEPTSRGPYTGAMGYLGFCGDMDLNIIIRSILIKGSKAYFQVGGGIVADSDPDKEYEETLAKAKALIEALKS